MHYLEKEWLYLQPAPGSSFRAAFSLAKEVVATGFATLSTFSYAAFSFSIGFIGV